jgi:hypothetical protein
MIPGPSHPLAILLADVGPGKSKLFWFSDLRFQIIIIFQTFITSSYILFILTKLDKSTIKNPQSELIGELFCN